MKVLIAYRSRYGATESCARDLAARISWETTLRDLRAPGHLSPSDFDVVLIGGSIYGGKIQREIPAFCDREQKLLLGRRVGVFICCFYTGERAMAELEEAFPPWLLAHTFSREILGGRLALNRLSLPDRLLVRSLAHPARDISTIRPDAIQRLASAVNALGPE